MSMEALAWLSLTILAWVVASAAYERLNRPAWSHPLILAAPMVFLPAWLFGGDWQSYRQATQPLTFLLAPGVVALALPLAREWNTLRPHWQTLGAVAVGGALFAAGVALAMAWLAGAPDDILRSVAPKSVTSAIALGIVEQTGGSAPLTAAVVLVTGIVGALIGPAVFRWLRIDDPRVIGFSLGLVAHIVGTARAAGYGRQAAAYAGLGMGLTGIVTAVALPLAFAASGS